MEPDDVAEAAGAQTEAVVEAALEHASETEAAAVETVAQITEAARHSEIMGMVNGRIGEIEQWRDGVNQQVAALQSQVESLPGQIAEMTAAIALLTSPPPVEPTPEPTPESEQTPPQQSTLPESAEDGPRESPAADGKPEHHRPSRPKRRFW